MMESYKTREEFLFDFLEENLGQYVVEAVNGYPDDGTEFPVDFQLLQRHRPVEAEQVLLDPKEWNEAGQRALQRYISSSGIPTVVDLRGLKFTFTGLPDACKVPISSLRAEDRGKLVIMEGQVSSVKEREELLTVGTFVCNLCESENRVNQDSSHVREPGRCGGCGGKKATFKLNPRRSTYTNIQECLLQEQIENLEAGTAPKQIVLRLVENHIDILAPGDRVTISGIYTGEHERRSRTIKTWIDVTAIRKKGEEIFLFKPDSVFIKRAKEFAADRPVENIIEAAAGDIFGHQFPKKAILITVVGGVRRNLARGKVRRGDSHVLLMGDPGVAKSQLLRLFRAITPRSIFTSGKGASAAGITAAVIKDEFSKKGDFTIAAGAMVLANGGTAFVDELDKMNKEDRSNLHQALEEQVITITKAGNAKGSLPSRCGMAAAANPKSGRFDPDVPLAEQFDIEDTLLTRFDLIVIMRDVKNRDADAALADHIGDLELHPAESEKKFDLEFIKQYIMYIKSLEPAMTAEAVDACKAYWNTIRAVGENVASRQLEGLFRMSEAHAKLHMREKVSTADAEFAISMHKQYVRLIGYDPVTGTLDLGNVNGLGHTLGQEDRRRLIIQVVREMKGAERHTSEDLVVQNLMARGLSEEVVRGTIHSLVKNSHGLYRPGGGGTLAPM